MQLTPEQIEFIHDNINAKYIDEGALIKYLEKNNIVEKVVFDRCSKVPKSRDWLSRDERGFDNLAEYEPVDRLTSNLLSQLQKISLLMLLGWTFRPWKAMPMKTSGLPFFTPLLIYTSIVRKLIIMPLSFLYDVYYSASGEWLFDEYRTT